MAEKEDKHPGGRPRKINDEELAEVLEAFRAWVEDHEDPTIVGFTATDPIAVKYAINKDNITDWGEFSELRKRAVEKQEYFLLSGATKGALNASVSIFRLKQPQHGFKDKTETDITSNGETIAPRIVSEIRPRHDTGTETETAPGNSIS